MSSAPAGAVVVAGAGPAGLTAALTLARAGREVVVVERESAVGGLARTVERDGYRFDLGGHRFFTRVPEVRAIWEDLLGDDMRVRRRRSRILFRGHFYEYPITAGSAFRGLGPVESARILASYVAAKLRPRRPETSLADWLVNRFGVRLFETFFRTYTEKVWGQPCESIGAQWAAQRIQGMSLRTAIADALRRGSGGQRTLATEFLYPRLGPGMLWDRMRERIEAAGGRVLTGRRVAAVRHAAGRVCEVEIEGGDGRTSFPAAHLVSTIPLRELTRVLAPSPAADVVEAARVLRHRDFAVVALILEGADPFPDMWLYLHDPQIRAGRVQNFRAWSPELVPAAGHTCLGMEYFCTAGDAIWSMEDGELVEVALRDLSALGFGGRSKLVAGHVVRVREAYPIYDGGWIRAVETIRRGLAGLSNLQLVGRNGMHRYNNMDHSMLTGMLAARNVLGESHDLWAVNADATYLEPSAEEPAPARAAT